MEIEQIKKLLNHECKQIKRKRDFKNSLYFTYGALVATAFAVLSVSLSDHIAVSNQIDDSKLDNIWERKNQIFLHDLKIPDIEVYPGWQ